MKKQSEIKTKEVPRIVWYFTCEECGKEISGNYEKQAISNLNSHMEKHSKIKKGGKKK